MFNDDLLTLPRHQLSLKTIVLRVRKAVLGLKGRSYVGPATVNKRIELCP